MKIYLDGQTHISNIFTNNNRVGVKKVIVSGGSARTIVPTNNQIKTKVVSQDKTEIKQVIVGRPVRRLKAATDVTIDTISGVDTSGKVNGSVLVYRTATSNFEATLTLEEQCINGGQY